MRRPLRGALATTAAAGLLSAVASGAPPRVPAAPLTPLPMLPSIARIRIDVLKTQVLIVHEVNLPRGEWKNDALDFYVAFGAPGAPRAIDAQLVALGDGVLEPDDADAGEALPLERAPHRPASAHPLLGKDAMAGIVIHVKRESLARALAPGNMATLRIRTALDLPEEDASGARGVVARLGASRGTPLTLGRLMLSAKAGGGPVARVDAHLCGPDAETAQLAIAVTPRPPPAPTTSPPTPPIAPVLAVRHAADDLCVRFWTASP